MIEFFGRLFFFRMRSWVYFFVLGAPFLVSFLFLVVRLIPLREAEMLIIQAEPLSVSSLEKHEEKAKFLKRYTGSDPDFIQSLEATPLLLNKRHQLTQMSTHPACAQRGRIQARLEQWDKSKTRLEFVEESTRSTKRVKEIEYRLKKPVEVEARDLCVLLSQMEDIQIESFLPSPHSPQMIIKEFSLSRNKDLYQLDFSLLQRELTP